MANRGYWQNGFPLPRLSGCQLFVAFPFHTHPMWLVIATMEAGIVYKRDQYLGAESPVCLTDRS